MRAVKERGFVARALHVVHSEGARDWPELRLVSVLPIRVPQHPRQVFIAITKNPHSSVFSKPANHKSILRIMQIVTDR